MIFKSVEEDIVHGRYGRSRNHEGKHKIQKNGQKSYKSERERISY